MVELRVDREAADDINAQLAALGIPRGHFLTWVENAEYDLSEEPRSKLTPICGPSRKITHHRYRSPESLGSQQYRIVWDLDWEREGDATIFNAFKVHIVPV
jgi:hypothetical protein